MSELNIIRHYQPLGGVCQNPGDNLVEIGAREVLPADGTTYLIGTPWFWDACEQSLKYAWLEQATKDWQSKRYAAIAIGACLDLDGDAKVLQRESTVEACKRLWPRFAKITVRDPVSQAFLESIGIESRLLPETALLVPPSGIPSTPGTTLIIDASPWHAGMAKERSLSEMPDYDTFLYQPGYYDEARLRRMLDFWFGYERIISLRLHAAGAVALHRQVAVMPTDSRATALTHWGIPEWPDEPRTLPLGRGEIIGLYREFLA